MKKFIIIVIVSYFYVSNLNAEESIRSLLKSEDWRERDKAISLISKDIEKYKNNRPLKEEIIRAVSDENERIKYLIRNKLISKEGGRGEYYIDLIDLMIRMDIPGSTKILFDYAGYGIKVEDAIVDNLIKEREDDMSTLLSLKEKFISNDLFYKGRKCFYLTIINKYLRKKEKADTNKREIMKYIVLKGLSLDDYKERIYAVRCSQFFFDDSIIIENLKKLSKNDKYFKFRKGVKIYPVRGEAIDVLREIEEIHKLD